MKLKVRTWMNVWMTAVLGFMGFSSFGCAMYGVPSGDLTFEGKVLNEEQEELPDIQVIRCGGWQDDIPQMYWESYADTLYTNSEGAYYKEYQGIFPLTYQKITITDPSGLYESQDTIISVKYKGGCGWYEGKAHLNLNFVLHRK